MKQAGVAVSVCVCGGGLLGGLLSLFESLGRPSGVTVESLSKVPNTQFL